MHSKRMNVDDYNEFNDLMNRNKAMEMEGLALKEDGVLHMFNWLGGSWCIAEAWSSRPKMLRMGSNLITPRAMKLTLPINLLQVIGSIKLVARNSFIKHLLYYREVRIPSTPKTGMGEQSAQYEDRKSRTRKCRFEDDGLCQEGKVRRGSTLHSF